MKYVFPFVLMLLFPALTQGHDTWLIPSAFRTTPGAAVRLRLATSEAFPSSEVAARPDRIARFTMRMASGTQTVAGYRVDGEFLVADVTVTVATHAVVVAETKPRALVLEPKIFNEYLEAEELRTILNGRAGEGQTNSAGRERYRKIAKTILCVGNPKDSSFAQPDGLWLEIVVEQTPCGLRVGESFTVRVLFGGKPLTGARVAAGYEGVTGHRYPVVASTDGEGRATLRFDRPGVWFLRTLHMVPVSGDPEADWHSAFSTLTFEVGR